MGVHARGIRRCRGGSGYLKRRGSGGGSLGRSAGVAFQGRVGRGGDLRPSGGLGAASGGGEAMEAQGDGLDEPGGRRLWSLLMRERDDLVVADLVGAGGATHAPPEDQGAPAWEV